MIKRTYIVQIYKKLFKIKNSKYIKVVEIVKVINNVQIDKDIVIFNKKFITYIFGH